MASDKFGIAFGVLHLCKSLINTIRCYSITHNGENFGLYILRALKHGNDRAAEILSNMKNAVLVGKDRQSDYLAYMTCSQLVESALVEKDVYSLIRVPEPILDYKENAKTQKPMIYPVAVQTNLNADIFVLDEGASCIHIFDTSDVCRSYIIGTYTSPDLSEYDSTKKLVAKNVKFSNSAKSMVIHNDIAFIADYVRNEIVVLMQCKFAQKVSTSRVFVMNVENCVDVCCVSVENMVLALCDDDAEYRAVYGLTFKWPSKKDGPLFVETTSNFVFNPSYEIQGLFSVAFNGYLFGARSEVNKLFFYNVTSEGCKETTSSLQSAVLPCTSEEGLVVFNQGYLESYYPSIKEENLSFSPSSKMKIICAAEHMTLRGNVLNVLGRHHENYVVEEVGQLAMGALYCRAVRKFYEAVVYVPPHGLNHLSPGLHEEVYPHTTGNESPVEHTFGFICKNGQGQSQTKQEYCSSKSKHYLNFHLRNCEMPFNQYEKIKSRDKGYQQLNPAMKSKLDVEQMKQLFSAKHCHTEKESPELSEEDEKILYRAYLLTKSVPQQTNRWMHTKTKTQPLREQLQQQFVEEEDEVY